MISHGQLYTVHQFLSRFLVDSSFANIFHDLENFNTKCKKKLGHSSVHNESAFF